jgi:hypothetical protein
MNKHVLYSIALSLAACVVPFVSRADTFVSGTISSDTTWGSGTYIVNGDVTVNNSATLTINPGVTVKFDSAKTLKIAATGHLVAEGTATNTILFTADTASPSKGYWDKIEFDSSASGTISNATVLYGGYNGYGGFYVNSGTLTLDAVEVSSIQYYAIWMSGGTLRVLDNSSIHGSAPSYEGISQNGGDLTVMASSLYDNRYGVNTTGSGSLTLVNDSFGNTDYSGVVNLNSGLVFTHSGNTESGGTELHGFLIYSTTASADQTLSADTLPYIISSSYGDFTIPASKTFTFQQGAVIKFSTSSSKVVVNGSLVAQGTSGSPVYFTSIYDSDADGINSANSSQLPVKGNWDTIDLKSGSSSTFTNAIVRYGGYSGGASQANFSVEGGTVAVSGTEIATSVYFGIYQSGGTLNLSGSDIHNNGAYGFDIAGGNATVTSSKVHNNTTYGAYITAGTNSISTTALHDNAYGIYDGGGNTTVTQADIYSNTYGIWVQSSSDDIGIEESAIDANSDHGVYNNTTDLLLTTDATYDWWNSTWGPHSSTNGSSGDAVTDKVTYSPWNHVNDPSSDSSVHGGEERWDGSTTYTTLWANSIDTWNTEGANDGAVTIVSATGSSDLTVSDSSTPFVIWDGRYKPKTTDPITPNDQLYVYTARIQADGLDTNEIQHVLTHELGHSLGLGHSASNDANNIMASSTNSRTTLGTEDQSDYRFLWVKMGWETLALP